MKAHITLVWAFFIVVEKSIKTFSEKYQQLKNQLKLFLKISPIKIRYNYICNHVRPDRL
jgi:EAL domain-containing protein (putative c-di-GMP-specific phosphodiesterase class I)